MGDEWCSERERECALRANTIKTEPCALLPGCRSRLNFRFIVSLTDLCTFPNCLACFLLVFEPSDCLSDASLCFRHV